MTRRPPRPPLFPYTTLFRSKIRHRQDSDPHASTVLYRPLPSSTVLYRPLSTVLYRPLLSSLSFSPRMAAPPLPPPFVARRDRKSTRLNSSHLVISYAVFCLK